MKIKIMLAIVAILLVVIVLVRRDNTEEVRQFMIPVEKLDFAIHFGFNFRLVVNEEVKFPFGFLGIGMYVNPHLPSFNPHFNELVFVHNLEEAESGNFPDNVIVAWPFMPLTTEAALAELHRIIENPIAPWGTRLAYDEINLEDFGLVYPITVDDLVDNWENMLKLWEWITFSGRDFIARPNIGGIPPRDLQVTPIVIDESYDISDEHRLMIEKFNYALALRFWFIISVDGRRILSASEVKTRIDPSSPNFDPFYTDIILMHHESGTHATPANVIVAFPMGGHDTRNLINRLHDAVNKQAHEFIADGEPLRDIIHFRDFGLSYPLDRDDLVDNWQQVNALWNALHPSEQETIRNIDHILERQN